MKKLNNKGFTLVELLAVIIILAIVVGISIPAITNVINDSKNNALGVAVDAASDYLTDQYALMNVDVDLVSGDFYNAFFDYTEGDEITLTDELIQAAGFSLSDVKSGQVVALLNKNTNKICVNVKEIIKNGKYYNVEHWDDVANPAGGETKNSNCP